MRRALASFALLLAGCQTFGAFSTPTTIPDGSVRVGLSGNYDAFHVSDQRFTAGDLAVVGGFGVSDRTEVDLLASASTVDFHLKHAFFGPGTFALSVAGGAGIFTGYAANSSAVYAPLELVAGVRPASDITLFAGPKVVGGLGLDPPTLLAGFDRGTWGLLAGGVGGIALESPVFTFCPQVTVLTPVGSEARGTVVQVSLGVATQFGR